MSARPTFALLDGRVVVTHLCRGEQVEATLNNREWRIVSADPLTVEPSVGCDLCGLHGWITNGWWNGTRGTATGRARAVADLHAQVLAEIERFDDALADPGAVLDTASNVGSALRAVVELHAPFQRSTLSLGCRACSTPVHTQPGRYVTVVNWPCSTIRVIADALGVTDQERIEKEEQGG